MTKIEINPILILFLFISNFLLGQEHHHEPEPFDIRHKGRLYWQMPRRVLEEIGIRKGMNVADIGCGDGYFTLVLAERVGPDGEVYAEDIDAIALDILEERRVLEGYENVTIIHGTPDDPKLPLGLIDVALIVNSLHFIDDLELFFEHVRRCLTDEGRLVVIQWAAEKMDSELPGWNALDREKYTRSTSLKRIKRAGFEVIEQAEFLPMQYIFICRPTV